MTLTSLNCGVSININNLKSTAQSQFNTFVNLNLGTPDGLDELTGQLGGALTDLGSSIASVIPSLPSVPLSLREELAALAALPLASVAAAGKILSIAEEFADAIGLRGFANLNLNDLSKSVFSLTGDFDPCNPSIPNILKNADGTLQKLPSIAPDLGSAVAAVNNIQIQEIAAPVEPEERESTLKTEKTGETIVETREVFIERIIRGVEV